MNIQSGLYVVLSKAEDGGWRLRLDVGDDVDVNDDGGDGDDDVDDDWLTMKMMMTQRHPEGAEDK